MKIIKTIPISQVIIDHLPLNTDGLNTAIAVHQNIPMPPIKVVMNRNGGYQIKDGRHRYLAYKLNGKNTIMAIVSKQRREEDGIN